MSLPSLTDGTTPTIQHKMQNSPTESDGKSVPSLSAVVTIRRLNHQGAAEIEAVVSLVNHCYRSTASWTHEAFLVSGKRISPDALLDDAQRYSCFVAVHAETDLVIGCVKTGLVSETVVGRLAEPMGYVGMMAVVPAWQSKGVANMLVSHAERFCRSLGASFMVRFHSSRYHFTSYMLKSTPPPTSLTFRISLPLVPKALDVLVPKALDVFDCRTDIISWYNRLGYKTTGKSVDPTPVLTSMKSTLLQPASFILLTKALTLPSQ